MPAFGRMSTNVNNLCRYFLAIAEKQDPRKTLRLYDASSNVLCTLSGILHRSLTLTLHLRRPSKRSQKRRLKMRTRAQSYNEGQAFRCTCATCTAPRRRNFCQLGKSNGSETSRHLVVLRMLQTDSRGSGGPDINVSICAARTTEHWAPASFSSHRPKAGLAVLARKREDVESNG